MNRILWHSALVIVVIGSAACGPAMDQTTADRLIAEARKLDLEGRTDSAVALYTEVLDALPDSYDAHYGIARALDLAGQYSRAQEHFARAIDLAPESDREQTLRMMGLSWTFARNAGEAARYFRDVFDRRVAAGSFAGAAEVANELGRAYLELGMSDEAEEWYRIGHETAARESDQPGWRIDLADMRWAHARARIAARRGDEGKASTETDRVSQILDRGGNDDQRVQYEYLRGYVEFHLGRPAAAVAALERADQADPFVLVLLAQAYEALGQADRAISYYDLTMESTSHGMGNAIARPTARARLAVLR